MQNLGRVSIGLGLMILSLGMVVGVAEPLRQSHVVLLVF